MNKPTLAPSKPTPGSRVPHAILVFNLFANLFFVAVSIGDAVQRERDFGLSLRLCSKLVVASFLLVGIPIIFSCMWGIEICSDNLVHPYASYSMLSPFVNLAVVVDSYVTSCGLNMPAEEAACGHVHGFKVYDQVLIVAVQVSLAFVFSSYVQQGLAAAGSTCSASCKNGSTREAPSSRKAILGGSTAECKTDNALGDGENFGKRPVLHLARGHEVYFGSIRYYNEKRGYGFVVLDGQSQDIYFKHRTLSEELQALGAEVVGVPVRFIVRWMPDGTPQVRAAVRHRGPRRGVSTQQQTESPKFAAAAQWLAAVSAEGCNEDAKKTKEETLQVAGGMNNPFASFDLTEN